jgi:integrase
MKYNFLYFHFISYICYYFVTDMSIKLREKNLANGVIGFYLDIYKNGVRNYQFLDIKIDPEDTKEIKNEKRNIVNLIRSNKEIEVLTENTNYLPKHLQNIYFVDFVSTFKSTYKKKDIRMIEAAIKQFNVFSNNPKLKLSEINPSLMKGFADYLNYNSGLSGETPHNYFTRFKKVLKEAEMKGLIKVSPTNGLVFKKKTSDDDLKKQVLTTDELKLLMKTECNNNEVKKAFLFSCYTGLGYAEIKKLKWENIENERLVTRREKTNMKINNKINLTILNLLGEKKSKDEFVFNLKNSKGCNISDNGINKSLNIWIKKANIDKHITFYCGRHTFATQLLIHGANLKTVADILGHSNTKNTIKYLNYIDTLKDEAVNNLPNLE